YFLPALSFGLVAVGTSLLPSAIGRSLLTLHVALFLAVWLYAPQRWRGIDQDALLPSADAGMTSLLLVSVVLVLAAGWWSARVFPRSVDQGNETSG
ncbi:MAG: hypothetical protein IT304_12675, partial [Dehalococcoidia bacterium]|nr:hypothetical protein [Dehalococcoidia bacterium]